MIRWFEQSGIHNSILPIFLELQREKYKTRVDVLYTSHQRQDQFCDTPGTNCSKESAVTLFLHSLRINHMG